MAVQNFKSARDLAKYRRSRNCISRSYYAAFSAITNEVRKDVKNFPYGYQHPPHRQLRKYIKGISQISMAQKKELQNIVSRLYSARLEADYHPERNITDNDARQSLRDATSALKLLGVDLS